MNSCDQLIIPNNEKLIDFIANHVYYGGRIQSESM